MIYISGFHIDGMGSNIGRSRPTRPNIESNSSLNPASIGNPNALSHGTIVFGVVCSTFIGLLLDMTCLLSGTLRPSRISACMTNEE